MSLTLETPYNRLTAGEPQMCEATERVRVVVIDNNEVCRSSCDQILSKLGYDVETFTDCVAGLRAMTTSAPDVAVVDLRMPGLSGRDVISEVRKHDQQIAIVVVTGYPTIGIAVEAMKAGADEFLPKPFSPDELRLAVKTSLRRRRQKGITADTGGIPG